MYCFGLKTKPMKNSVPPVLTRHILWFLFAVCINVDAAPLPAQPLTNRNSPAVAALPPYPLSTLISSITWHWDTYTTAAPGSDLWPVTWGPDNHLYAAWGDGGGFGGSDTDARVAMG